MKYQRLLPTLCLLFVAACGGGPNSGTDSDNTSSSSSSSSNSSSASSSTSSSSGQNNPGVVTRIEEGDQAFCPFSGTIDTLHDGYTGAGYANAVNASGSSLTWAISVTQAGPYVISIRYANGSASSRPAVLSAAQNTQNLNFATTEVWTSWQTEQVSVVLESGQNTITLTASSDEGLSNIDALTLTGSSQIGAGMCPEQPSITVWLAGDSTVANGQTPCPVGWGKTLGEYFDERVTVKNSAAGGRSVRTWLYDTQDIMGSDGECTVSTSSDGSPVLQSRWSSMLSQMSAGDYLFIQFGINDGASTCPRHVGSNAFKEGYIYMANEAMSRGVHPILLTPSPALRCSGSSAVASRGFLSETFAVGSQLNIPVIDLHEQGTQLYNQLAFCPVSGGDVSAATGGEVGDFFCNDHTHFDTPGARKMGQIIVDSLRSQAIPLANYLIGDK